jgi:flagellar basal-body rod protein FlgB
MLNDPSIDALSRFLDVSVFRSGLILSNMANVDTPGYRTRDLNFSQELERAASGPQDAVFTPAVRQIGGLIERPDGNNVNLERESMLLADTQLRFNACVQLLRDRFKMLSSAIHEGSAQ